MVANDEKIQESGGENQTDDINNIKLIDKPEYNKLPEKEKPNWTKYSPSLSSQAMVLAMKSTNGMTDIFNQFGPLLSKITPLTGGKLDAINTGGFIQLLEAIEPPIKIAEKFTSMLEPLDNEFTKPVIAPLETLAGLIGSLAGLVYVLIMNPYNMLSSYIQVLDDIEWDKLKEKFDTETTPNMELLSMQMDETVIPDKDMKQYFNDNIKSMTEMTSTMNDITQSVTKVRETMERLKKVDEDARTILKAMNTMGLSVLLPKIKKLSEKLEINYAKIKEEMDKSNKYKKDAKKFAGSANNFLNNLPQKYILVSDLEKLKKMEEEQKNKKIYNDGHEKGYKEGGKSCEEYLDKLDNINDVDLKEMERFYLEELQKKKTEYEEKEEVIWINGYEIGFKKGFYDRYDNAQKYEEKEGYDDGYDDGESACKKYIKNFNTSTLSEEQLQAYINKMISQTNLSDKSSFYQSGYYDGYEKGFMDKLETYRADDKEEGYDDGYDDGYDGCKNFLKGKSDEEIRNITEIQIMEEITQIVVNKDNSKMSTYYQEQYHLGVQAGFLKEYESKLKDSLEEEREQGYDDGRKAGEIYGINLSNLYEKHLEDTGIISLTDRLIEHEKYHDDIVKILKPEIPSGVSDNYKNGYLEGYSYGFTDGYYDAIEIIK